MTHVRAGTLIVMVAAAVAACTAPAGRSLPHQPHSESAGAAAKPALGAFQLAPVSGPGFLAAGSDPAALPGDVLIADEDNNRLLLVDPYGRIRWQFPGLVGASGRRAFGPPDDAFVSRDGRTIIATQEMYDTVALIDIATGRVVRSYGHPGTPGSAAGYFSHPDDAMLLPDGDLLLADIVNCRILDLAPGVWQVRKQLGTTAVCGHDPPALFGSPNGAFPLADGHILVTEINDDWVDELDLHGHVYWSAHPPGVAYPSDASEVTTGRYIVCDYSSPGQVVIFDRAGRALWRYRPTGANALNHPSLALPLPNGDVLVNDDYNDRVIVISPRSGRIVWQYGHRGTPGDKPGYLSNPDGVDMAPPYSLLMTK
jgi:outer membrane protein assembly factor BamB